MAKKSLNFLKRRSKCKNLGVVDEKSPMANAYSNRASSCSTIDEFQIALFYSDQEKAKMMPIPTAPPSPPKGKPNALTKVTVLQDCSSPLKCEAPTATQLPLSPPVSPMSNASSKESTLDRGKRLTVVERRPSPHAGSSMASNLTGEC